MKQLPDCKGFLAEISRAFDTIIWGTGFEMRGWGTTIPTKGPGGLLLWTYWQEEPKTLYGKLAPMM
jgi:hypothetical protein